MTAVTAFRSARRRAGRSARRADDRAIRAGHDDTRAAP